MQIACRVSLVCVHVMPLKELGHYIQILVQLKKTHSIILTLFFYSRETKYHIL